MEEKTHNNHEGTQIVRFLGRVDTQFKSARALTIAVLLCSALSITACVFFTMRELRSATNRIYILDEGSVISARSESSESQRNLEIRDHVIRFHELILNISPNKESIEYNQRRAFVMCDGSGRRYCANLAEKGFYNELISIDAIQHFRLDSVKVDYARLPYRAALYGKLYFRRRSNLTIYDFESSCSLVNTERSETNPHGLMIQNFTGRQALVEQR